MDLFDPRPRRISFVSTAFPPDDEASKGRAISYWGLKVGYICEGIQEGEFLRFFLASVSTTRSREGLSNSSFGSSRRAKNHLLHDIEVGYRLLRRRRRRISCPVPLIIAPRCLEVVCPLGPRANGRLGLHQRVKDWHHDETDPVEQARPTAGSEAVQERGAEEREARREGRDIINFLQIKSLNIVR